MPDLDARALGGDIELVMPGSDLVVRLTRLLASGVASLAGLDVLSVDDLRMGVDEICTSLIEASDHGQLSLVFSISPRALDVTGTAAGDTGRLDPARTVLAEQILSAVADSHGIEQRDGQVRAWLHKEVAPR